MMKRLVTAGWLMVLASCSILKNSNSNKHIAQQQSSYQASGHLVENRDWLNRSRALTFYADSSNQDYTIQLWPKGRFSYSAEAGFSGEADKILITGKSTSGSSSLAKVDSEESDRGKTEIQTNLKAGTSSSQKDKLKKSSVSWKVILALTVLVLIAACFAYRKITKIIKT